MTDEAMKAARRGIERKLGAYRAIAQEIAQIEAQLKYLDGAPSGVRLDGMPKGNSTGDPVASIVDQRMALAEKQLAMRAELYAAQRHVEELIESLEPVERKLLRHRYIEGLSWRQVCRKMSYCRKQVYNIHIRALSKLVEIENTSKGLTDICD